MADYVPIAPKQGHSHQNQNHTQKLPTYDCIKYLRDHVFNALELNYEIDSLPVLPHSEIKRLKSEAYKSIEKSHKIVSFYW